MKKVFAMTCAVMGCAAMLAISAMADGRTIGVAIYDQTNLSLEPELASIFNSIEDHGDTYVALDASEDYASLPDLVTQLVVQEVDGIVLVNLFPDACVNALQGAKDQGIPAVVVDCGITDEDEDLVVGQSVSDNRGAGKGIIESYVENYGDEGNVILISANNTVPAVERLEGMYEGVEGTNLNVLLEEMVTDLSVSDATQRVENMIQKFGGNEIDAIFCAFGNVAIGASAACQSTGFTDIKIYGIDASSDEMALIAAGMEEASVGQDFVMLGQAGVDKLYTVLEGGEVEDYYTYVPVTVVTKDNLAEWKEAQNTK